MINQDKDFMLPPGAEVSIIPVVPGDGPLKIDEKDLPDVLPILALRNAVLPSITVAGLNFGQLVGGSVAIETVFAIPGVGRLMIDNIKLHDTPTVIGCMVFVSVMVSIINLLVDILYGLIDPRIKAQYVKGNKNGKRKNK